MSENSTASTVLNKIIIPVITTVLGATAIYFLGFNRKGSSSNSETQKAAIIKESTISSWKSFVTSQNIAYRNMSSITTEYSQKIDEASVEVMQQKSFKPIVYLIPEFKNELVRESKKTIKDLDELLRTIDVDKDFINMLNRTRENMIDQEKKVATLFDELESIAQTNASFEEKQQKWVDASNRFSGLVAGVEKRAATEAEDIAKILSERYNHKFDMNDLQVYTDYIKERAEGRNDPPKFTVNERPAPADPRGGTEYKPEEKETKDDEPTFAITKKWITGKWKMTKGNTGHIDLAADGAMYWEFKQQGVYTSGDWKWNNGIVTMNATNPETGKKILMVGDVSDATETSFTLTLRSVPKEIYYFKK